MLKRRPRHFVNKSLTSSSSTGMLTFACPFCEEEIDVPITEERYDNYLSGKLVIQDLFPELTPSQREAIQTGICDSCWGSSLTDDADN